MSKKPEDKETDRRKFLKLVGVARASLGNWERPRSTVLSRKCRIRSYRIRARTTLVVPYSVRIRRQAF